MTGVLSGADWSRPDSFKDTQCRNIIIHGYCKFENEGCQFNHGNSKETENPTTEEAPVARSMTPLNVKFNAKTSSSFTPGKSPVVRSPDFSTAPSFQPGGPVNEQTTVSDVPRGNGTMSPTPMNSNAASFAPSFNPYASESFTPSVSAGGIPSSQELVGAMHGSNASISSPIPSNPYASSTGLPSGGMVGVGHPMQGLPPPPPSGALPMNPITQFPTVYPPTHSVLQYHLYAPDPPPHLKIPLKPNERTPETLFINNHLRDRLVKNNQTALQVFPRGSLPDIVGDYFGLVPMDFHNRTSDKKRYNGHDNSLYKVFSNLDGKIYFMRRIHDVKITDVSQVSKPFQVWSKIRAANITVLKDSFVTSAFNDTSLCMVFDYYPQSQSLYETYGLNNSASSLNQEMLWSYLIQLTIALQTVHHEGLALNGLDWKKVIVTSDPARIKVTDIGVFDTLNYHNEGRVLHKEQQQTYVELAELMMNLVHKLCGTQGPIENLNSYHIDPLFKSCVQYLFDSANDNKNIEEFTKLFAPKLLSVINSLQFNGEYLEQQLSRELENARLFRLICKLNAIYGRLESRIDINWAESGEKFPIILFFDYVFHQKDDTGKNVMDLTHVLRCLNKLDAGVSERFMLVTPDEMNCIIISYKELKDLIDSTFRSLTQ
ncbi:unnamed protein product [Kluyveromyces dobzhanskii CBS 2104]|uniref:PAN2-PAN3 deadenylation complex subunit PAN3 n=1 Tax=Kluyveromyces dobzhanskii CBS 2104 TaxID=1427455 RepID=A0A0A8L8N7_9SACH|nr:unnamed protein product [Kluyveromyces dobzhanskii CBS 2104]